MSIPRVDAYLKKLYFHSMDDFPWEKGDGYYKEVPRGIVLRRYIEKEKRYEYTIVGDDICGYKTTGCSCCSAYWQNWTYRFDGWAWMFDLSPVGYRKTLKTAKKAVR